jgi:hypothetical protein
MKLTIGEKIMVARERKCLSRKAAGYTIYIENKLKDLDFPDGRLKKIEKGIIQPEGYLENELFLICKTLDIPYQELTDDFQDIQSLDSKALSLKDEFLEYYPSLPKYFNLLNAVVLVDRNLCGDNFIRMAEYVDGCNKKHT